MSGPGTTPYTSQTISGYNASPPADDGSQTAANQIFWATIKTKLDDPIKTLSEAINTANVAAFAKTINTDDGVKNDIAGNIGFEFDELTISSGSVTPNRTHHTIDTESDAASDDLANILTTNMATNAILIVRAADTTRTVVLKHAATGAGQMHNIYDADITLDDDQKIVIYMRIGTDWYEIGRNFTSPVDMGALSSPDKINDKVAVVDATDGMVKYATMIQFGGITSGTEQASTSGTAFDWTSIPSGTKRITVMLDGVSLSGTDDILVQIGDSGGIETSGYLSSSGYVGGATSRSSTAGFIVLAGNSGYTINASITLSLEDSTGFTWVESHGGANSNSNALGGGGSKSLSAELDRVRITRTGTDTFDAGAVNILYE